MTDQFSPTQQAAQHILVLVRLGHSISIGKRRSQDAPFESELKGIFTEDTAEGREYMREVAEIFQAEYRRVPPIDL